jgi:hypothetical protein
MKDKSTQSVCKHLVVVWIFVILTGCTNPILHDRPPDAACKDYLTGKQILLKDGLIFDTVWQIESNEFSSFSVTGISNNKDGSKAAKVRFELKDGPKHLQVDGMINYSVHQQDEVVRMLSFTPERVLKLGKW